MDKFKPITRGVVLYLSVIVVAIFATPEGRRLTSIPQLFDTFRPSTVLSTLYGNNIFDDMTMRPAQSNLSTPTLEQIMYYNHFAAAVFCNNPALSSWSCDDCVATGPDVKLFGIVEHPENYIRAFIAINTVAKEIMLVFRGAITILNWLEDYTVEQIAVPGGNGNIMVHKGGWLHWLSIKNLVLREFRDALRNHSEYHVIVIGWSFGGMVASLCLYDLKHTTEFSGLQYSLYTYGGQRTGNLDFAMWVNSQNIPAIRVVNNADVIPHTYTSSLGYVHHSRELWINGDKNIFCSEDVLEDPNCSNSLGPSYTLWHHAIHWDVYIPPNDCIISNSLSYIAPSLKGRDLNLLLFNRSTYDGIS